MTYKDFCDWVASEIFSENWEFNKESLFEEVACRNLVKLGIVEETDGAYALIESEDEEE